ncbi:SDR family NAD(P)-dependent oxidoreductase [Granulicella sp. L60]|uniref:SDR family NAD(P)-dependent oxidoreductase n=1 Tax=Granulicella sp. L60 TaxID=1641866 RepID=UPI001C2056B1|nr:SDR family NAD(P)-dependent oxidoreductase [Granulicella sp. L60]
MTRNMDESVVRPESTVTRRDLLASGGAILGGMAMTGQAFAQQAGGQQSGGEQTGGDPLAVSQTWAGKPFGSGLLARKVAVITGAARGIGRSIAVDMAANGADIVAIDICAKILKEQSYAVTTRDDLEETARLVQQNGRKCMQVVGDVRDIAFLRATADKAEQQFGHIDIVVANAATQHFKPLVEMEDWEFNGVIENNLIGTANTIRAFAPKMIAQGKGGRIIVLSSMQGKHGSKNMSSYSASKWGILGLMKSAALELGKYKITVNALVPGLVDTPLTHNEERWSALIGEVTANDNPPKNPTEQQAYETRAPHVPLKVGWLKPEDLAPAAVFLASDGAAMVTGASYDVTGGDNANNQS